MHLAMLIFILWHQLQRNDNGRASAQGGVELIHISKKQLLCHAVQPTLKLFTWTCVQLHRHQCPSDPDDKRLNDTLDGSACHGPWAIARIPRQLHLYTLFFCVSFRFVSFFFSTLIFSVAATSYILPTSWLLPYQKQTAVTQSKQAASSPFNVSFPRNHPITAVNVH